MLVVFERKARQLHMTVGRSNDNHNLHIRLNHGERVGNKLEPWPSCQEFWPSLAATRTYRTSRAVATGHQPIQHVKVGPEDTPGTNDANPHWRSILTRLQGGHRHLSSNSIPLHSMNERRVKEPTRL